MNGRTWGWRTSTARQGTLRPKKNDTMDPWTLRELAGDDMRDVVQENEKDALHVCCICQVLTLKNGLRHSERYSNGLKHFKGDVSARWLEKDSPAVLRTSTLVGQEPIGR